MPDGSFFWDFMEFSEIEIGHVWCVFFVFEIVSPKGWQQKNSQNCETPKCLDLIDGSIAEPFPHAKSTQHIPRCIKIVRWVVLNCVFNQNEIQIQLCPRVMIMHPINLSICVRG